MTMIDETGTGASGSGDDDRGTEGTATREDTLAGILQATASSLAAARAVMETAAQTAFTFFADADVAERALLMGELANTSLAHDAILAGYANALDGGVDDPNGLVKQHGYRSIADLLQHELGRRKHDTSQLIRLAHVIRDGIYPTLAVAVEDGRVSLHQAGVIVAVLDEEARYYGLEDIEAVESAATNFATGTDTALPLKPEQLQKLVRAWFKQRRPEKVELDSAEQHELRACSYGTGKNGMIRLRALLPADEGAAVMQFLDANAAPRVRFTDPDQTENECCCTDPENQCGAVYIQDPPQGHGSNGAGALLVTTHCPGCAPVDGRTRKQKVADAFTTAFTIAAKSKATSTQGGACPTLTVTIPVGELTKHADGIPAVATVQRTEEIVPAHVAARILCDGAIQAAVSGDNGEVLHLGRSQRLFTPTQRTALNLEYPTCAVPDCDIPSVWCEAHHVTWWSRGGKTDIDNGVLLCNYHHHQVHTGALDIVPAPSTDNSVNGDAVNGGRRRWRVRRTARIRAGTIRPARVSPGADIVDPKTGTIPITRPTPMESIESNPDPTRDIGVGTGTKPSTDKVPKPQQQRNHRPSPGATPPRRRGDRPQSDKTTPGDDEAAEPE